MNSFGNQTMLVLVVETHFVEYFNEIGNDGLKCDSQIQFDVQHMPKNIQNNTRQVTRSLNDKFTSKLLLYHHKKAAFQIEWKNDFKWI